jgi:hypothetical protein
MENKLILFITILAWVVGSISTILLLMRLYLKLTYTELDATIDAVLKNKVYSWPLTRPFMLAVVCWTWVLTFQYF